jgi:hypothetical protein
MVETLFRLEISLIKRILVLVLYILTHYYERLSPVD